MSKSEHSAIDEEAFRHELRSKTRRGFAISAAAFAVGAAGWTAFLNSPRDGRINRAMRRALELHEAVGRATFRSSSRAAEFPISQAEEPIVNGLSGIFSSPDTPQRTITAVGEAGAKAYSLGQILQLPRVEMTAELRCVEGWSTIVHWSGVRLKDFASATGIASRTSRPGDVLSRRGDALRYARLVTPDGLYYVGLDVESALHSQTLLCDRMNGEPLSEGHGGPLRLVIPTKYGYKSLKRIGEIHFGDRRPSDFWAEMGYDWYAGL